MRGTLFAEAVVVGFVLVIVGLMVGALLHLTIPSAIDPQHQAFCEGWNKYHVMELSLFLTGVFAHLLFEATGVNKWYCSHGVACRK